MGLILPDDLYRFARDTGIKRFDHRIKSGYRPEAARGASIEKLLVDEINGAVGEAGVYFWLGGKRNGVKWNAFLDIPLGELIDLPDMEWRGHIIDVKAIANNKWALAVFQRELHLDWDYILVGVEGTLLDEQDIEAPPMIEILGWCPGRDVAKQPVEQRKPGRVSHFIDQDNRLLRPAWTFRAL